MIWAKTMMVTIAWNLLDFHFVDGLPKAQTFNANYCIEYILQQILGLRVKLKRQYLVILTDNARSHIARKFRMFCEWNSLRTVLCLPYPVDLTPSDFFHFGYVKPYLKGTSFSSAEKT
jgi:hypothetical protein